MRELRSRGRFSSFAAGLLVLSLGLVSTAIVEVGSAGAASSVRGFDGSTITVAGLGIKAQLPNAERGARARIKRFNDRNEIKGITIRYTELADDKQDPATALSEARRLVTQTGVFAIVSDVSANNPGGYFRQQRVPYFGGGFDATYCSSTPSTSLWGFSVGGCTVPSAPSFVSDNFHAMYQYVKEKTGKAHPTVVLFGNDNESAKNGNAVFAVAAHGAGFEVVDVQNTLPLNGNVTDYTPYAQAVTEGDRGKSPDATFCTAQVQCLNMYEKLSALGFTGIFSSGLYSDALVTQLDGSAVNFPSENYAADTAGMRQMKADLDAYESGSSNGLDTGDLFGYTSTDFFIQVLKKVAAKGTSNITPENVQRAASTFTWNLPGVKGPTRYPKSSVMGFPACFPQFVSDGDQWVTAVPYTCSTRTYSPDTNVG